MRSLSLLPLLTLLIALVACGAPREPQQSSDRAVAETLLVKFQLYDHNGDGFIDAAEFFRTPISQRSDALQIFDRLDSNGDGFISPAEARVALQNHVQAEPP